MSNLTLFDEIRARAIAGRVNQLLTAETRMVTPDGKAAVQAYTQAALSPQILVRVTCKTVAELLAVWQRIENTALVEKRLDEARTDAGIGKGCGWPTIELTNGSAIEFCLDPPVRKEGAA